MTIKQTIQDFYDLLKPFPSEIEDRRITRRIYRKIVYPLGLLSWLFFVPLFIILQLVDKEFEKGWSELR